MIVGQILFFLLESLHRSSSWCRRWCYRLRYWCLKLAFFL